MKKKYSKRYKELTKNSENLKPLKFDDIISKVKKNCTSKFDESIDVSLLLNLRQKEESLIILNNDIINPESEYINLCEINNKNDLLNGFLIFICKLEKMDIIPDLSSTIIFNMMKNINLTKGLIFSQEVLLALVKSGITRENANPGEK